MSWRACRQGAEQVWFPVCLSASVCLGECVCSLCRWYAEAGGTPGQIQGFGLKALLCHFLAPQCWLLAKLLDLGFLIWKMEVIEIFTPSCHADQMGSAGDCVRNRT